MKTHELFPTTSLIVAIVPVLGLGTRIALENMGPNFSVGWTARPTDNIAVYRRYSTVCAIRIGVQSQARPPWPSVPKISLTGTSSACPSWPSSQGHRSVPFVSGTRICTFRLRRICLWHPSWPSASGTSISAFCVRDNSLHHSSWLSVSRTSDSTFRLRDIRLHHPSRRAGLAIRLGDIRRGLQNQDQIIYFNHH